jgi:hypothetical protein
MFRHQLKGGLDMEDDARVYDDQDWLTDEAASQLAESKRSRRPGRIATTIAGCLHERREHDDRWFLTITAARRRAPWR